MRTSQKNTSTTSGSNGVNIVKYVAYLVGIMVAYVAAMAAVRQYLGDDLGEACSPDSEISCKFGMTCVDEVCAPYCESDEDCPGDIQCQSLEDTETPSDDADWVCDMPTELEQKLRKQLDRDVRPLIRPLAEGASRP